MALQTVLGKEAALKALADRREQNKDNAPTNNAALPPGSPMYFNCLTCNGDIVVAEGSTKEPDLCKECQALQALGWLE